MDLLHNLMPALEATGLVPAASMNVRPETHKGLLPQQVAELPRCRGADRPTVSKCAKHDDDEACAICLCEIAEDEDGGDYFYGDDDDDDASDADAPGSDAVLARELAEQFALEDLQEQRRELLGSFAMTLVARANSASRAVHSPRQLVRHRELLAQVSESMDLLHSLMPALEATGLVLSLIHI